VVYWGVCRVVYWGCVEWCAGGCVEFSQHPESDNVHVQN